MGVVTTKHNGYFCKKSTIEVLDTGDFTGGVNCTFLMSSTLVWYKVVSLECAMDTVGGGAAGLVVWHEPGPTREPPVERSAFVRARGRVRSCSPDLIAL